MLINYKNAHLCQQDGREVLSGVDFHVDDGEFVYVIGRVGAGKSSLLKTIYFELDIDEADEATVFDANLLTLKRKQVPALRRQMGIIFQDFQLLADRSVMRNLQFVLRATGWKKKDEISARIDEVLALVGMADKKDKMPHELSGGEQQRIAIARAILNSPKMIIADEPTGNLDPETAKNIMLLLKEIASQGTAVVMSTHNIGLIGEFPGIVYQCHEGRLDDVTNHWQSAAAAGSDEEEDEEEA